MHFSISLETDPEYRQHVYLIIDEFVPTLKEYLKDKKYAADIDAYWILHFLYNEETTKRCDADPAYYRNYKPAILEWKTRKIATMQETDYLKLDAAGKDNQLIIGVIGQLVLESIGDTRRLKIKFDVDLLYEDLQNFFIAGKWIES